MPSAGPPVRSGSYNNNMMIFQSPGYVTILNEMVHDARIVPLVPRDPLPGHLRQWMGDSRGRWDGDTLVIETTGFLGTTWFDRSGNFHSDALRVVERITPRSPDTLLYEATIEDPNVFTRPWTMRMPLYRRVEEGAEILEFRCIEFVEDLVYGHLAKQPGR